MALIPSLSDGGIIKIQGPRGTVRFRVLISELSSTYFDRKVKKVEKT